MSYLAHSFANWVFGLGGISGVIAILAWLLWFATPTFLLQSKALILQIAVGATVFAFAWSYASTTNYKAGYGAALRAIEKQNEKLGRIGSGAWKDVKQCFDNGGEWSAEDGACRSD